MIKIQWAKRFLPPEHPDFVNFPENSPLKIRGGKACPPRLGRRGSYVDNPLIPPYFKGEIEWKRWF
ncbi:MAG: hypothetical protein HXY36_07425 [Chloroflexi bacterium]|nr:hypothetical protein [Chloroflexota bacterium]